MNTSSGKVLNRLAICALIAMVLASSSQATTRTQLHLFEQLPSTVADKNYNGTRDATVTCGTLDPTGIAEGDTVNIVGVIATFSDKWPGREKTVTIEYILDNDKYYIANETKFANIEISDVTTLEDTTDPNDGKVSLREAITYSNEIWGQYTEQGWLLPEGAKTIAFDTNLEGTVVLESDLPAISHPFDIDGGKRITIDGDGKYAILSIDGTESKRVGTSDEPVTITGLTLTGGRATGGDMAGGAINAKFAYVSMGDMVITNNPIASEDSAAVFNNGILTINGPITLGTDGDRIRNAGILDWNLTDEHTTCLFGYDRIDNFSDDAKLQLTVDGIARTNIVIATDNTPGGSTRPEGDFIIKDAKTGAITNASINASLVNLDNFGFKLISAGNGKAGSSSIILDIYNLSSRKVVEGGQAVVIDEDSINVSLPNESSGGAIKVEQGGTLSGTNVTFAANETTQLGGAIYNNGTTGLNGAKFSGNTANDGGAIYNNGTFELTGGTISGNGASSSGGAINNSGEMTITNCSFSDNSANEGGAINNSGEMTVTDSTFSGNSANEGGAINNTGTMSMSNVGFQENSASGGATVNNTVQGIVNLDGSISFAAGEILLNEGTINWNIARATGPVLIGFENLENAGGSLNLVFYDNLTEMDFVIAKGDFTDVAGKDEFTISNLADNASEKIKIGNKFDFCGMKGMLSVRQGYAAAPANNKLLAPSAAADAVLVLSLYKETVTIPKPVDVENAVATVCTNGVPVPADDMGRRVVYTNELAYVVYTAESGYCFADGTGCASNKLDTSRNPVQVAGGETLPKAGKPTLKLGVVAQRYPWNGIVDIPYRAQYWPAGKAASVEVIVEGNIFTNTFDIAGAGTIIGTTNIDMKAMVQEEKGSAKFRVVEE